MKYTIALLYILTGMGLFAQYPNMYDVDWKSQSHNASESMPCGGGDIGMNVWVENNELMIYIDRSGNIDENDQQLKSGRIRVKIDPNPFTDSTLFSQKLDLNKGCIYLNGKGLNAKIWVEVFNPIIHIEIKTEKPSTVQSAYESWRMEKYLVPRTLNDKGEIDNWDYNRWQMFGYFWYDGDVFTYPDSVSFTNNNVLFFHSNNNLDLIFDKELELMRLMKSYNIMHHPTKNRVFGGMMTGNNMTADGNENGKYGETPYRAWKIRSISPATNHQIKIFMHTSQTEGIANWQKELDEFIASNKNSDESAWEQNINWWNEFWDRSKIIINESKGEKDSAWQASRNYTLFRYQLACNATGEWPTRFNGGLFTYDPIFVDHRSSSPMFYNPDFRAWGAWTAQNQRLVYWPMLMCGDYDMMKPQFNFYRDNLPNTVARTFDSWGIEGCSFCEQIGSGGLPIGSHYGWEPPYGKRPAEKEMGLSDLHATYYTTQLEFAYMINEMYRYSGENISSYIPFIKQSVIFHFEYFQMLQKQRTGKPYDDKGFLNIEPSHALETYHGKNATDVISALRVNLECLINLPDKWVSAEEKKKFSEWLTRLPDINYRMRNGYKTISPLEEDKKTISNYELPQLYPVFPWGIYGIGKPDLDVAINTWHYGIDLWPGDTTWMPGKSFWFGWTQQAIMLARMGLTSEAKEYMLKKMMNARVNNDKNEFMRFPTFWGPGFDWTPDHNHGGSGMKALQEMLMQTPDEKICILPAWPKEWDVDFKLHAPQNTTVSCSFKNGKIVELKVVPESRKKDIITNF